MNKPFNPDEPTEPTKPNNPEPPQDKGPHIDPDKANANTVPGKPPPPYGGAQGAASRMENEIAKGPRYDHGKTKPLGEGGTADVRAIEDEWLRREVARKMALPKYQGTPLESRLVLEAYITGILEHSSVVPVHDIGVTRNTPEAPPKVFFTMKKVDGPDVSTIIHLLRAPLAKLSPDEQATARDVRERFGSIAARLGLFMKVCDALAFAHDGIKEEAGLHIIHRDLKPANIMVGEFGQVFVMDWGLAKVLGESTTAKALRARRAELDSMESQEGTIDIGVSDGFMGTWHYAAPEQVKGLIDQLDRRTDVYALGCFLYHLLTLELPLDVPKGLNRSQTEEAVVDLIKNGKTVPRLRTGAARSGIHDKVEKPSVPTTIPKALRAMILEAVDPDPGKRPKTVMELHMAVAAYLGNEPNEFEGKGVKQWLYYLVRRNPGVSLLLLLGIIGTSFFALQLKFEVAAKNDFAHKAQQNEMVAEAKAKEATSERDRANAEARLKTAALAQSETLARNQSALLTQASEMMRKHAIDLGGTPEALAAIAAGLRYDPKNRLLQEQALDVLTWGGGIGNVGQEVVGQPWKTWDMVLRHEGDNLMIMPPYRYYGSPHLVDSVANKVTGNEDLMKSLAIAVCAADGTVEVVNGQGIKVALRPAFEQPNDAPHVIVSRDLAYALVVSSNEAIHRTKGVDLELWQTNAEPRVVYKASEVAIISATFSADGKRLAYAFREGSDSCVEVVDTTKGAVITRLSLPKDIKEDDVTCVGFGRNGRSLAASVGYDGEVLEWDIASEKLLGRASQSEGFPKEGLKRWQVADIDLYGVSVRGDPAIFLVSKKGMCIWENNQAQQFQEIPFAAAPFTTKQLEFDIDRMSFVCVRHPDHHRKTCTVSVSSLWDPVRGEGDFATNTIEAELSCAATKYDGLSRYVWLLSADGQVQRHNANEENTQLVMKIPHPNGIDGYALSETGIALLASREGFASWNIKTGKPQFSRKCQMKWFTAVSADGSHLLYDSDDDDYLVEIETATSTEKLLKLPEIPNTDESEGERIRDTKFVLCDWGRRPSNLESMIVSAYEYEQKIFACANQEIWIETDVHGSRPFVMSKQRNSGQWHVPILGRLSYATFSEDGRLLITGTSQGQLAAWDIRPDGVTFRAQQKFDSDTIISSIALAQDGNHIAFGTNEGTLGLWNLVTQDVEALDERQSKPILGLQFVGDTDHLVTNFDGAFRLVTCSPRPEFYSRIMGLYPNTNTFPNTISYIDHSVHTADCLALVPYVPFSEEAPDWLPDLLELIAGFKSGTGVELSPARLTAAESSQKVQEMRSKLASSQGFWKNVADCYLPPLRERRVSPLSEAKVGEWQTELLRWACSNIRVDDTYQFHSDKNLSPSAYLAIKNALGLDGSDPVAMIVGALIPENDFVAERMISLGLKRLENDPERAELVAKMMINADQYRLAERAASMALASNPENSTLEAILLESKKFQTTPPRRPASEMKDTDDE